MSHKILVRLLRADYTFDAPYVGQVLPAYEHPLGYKVVFPVPLGDEGKEKTDWFYAQHEVEVVDV